MRPFGFTLIDLLTTLAVVSILFGFGLPNFSSQIQNTKVRAAAQEMLDSLELTRTKAVATNSRVTMKNRGDWNSGWEVFIDKNNDGDRSTNETTITQIDSHSGVFIKANTHVNDYVSYTGTGESRNANGSDSNGAFQAGSFKVCPEDKGKGLKLIISRGGRVRQSEISAQECAIR